MRWHVDSDVTSSVGNSGLYKSTGFNFWSHKDQWHINVNYIGRRRATSKLEALEAPIDNLVDNQTHVNLIGKFTALPLYGYNVDTYASNV